MSSEADSSEAVEAAWHAEIQRRVDDLTHDRVELLPGRKVFEDLRAELRAIRRK